MVRVGGFALQALRTFTGKNRGAYCIPLLSLPKEREREETSLYRASIPHNPDPQPQKHSCVDQYYLQLHL